MDFTARKRKIQKFDTENISNKYSNDLNMYTGVPEGEVNINEFESLAVDRLQLLRTIESASTKGHKPFSEEWRKCIKEELTKLELKKFVRLMDGLDGQKKQDIDARRADFLSHNILRLAYCRSEELRRWFINRELEWFKLRFIVQNQNTLNRFFEINQLIYFPITDEQKEEIFNELMASTANMSDVSISTTSFYKVPFTEVGSLLRSRRVFLKLGFAYIPTSDLIVCVQGKFRSNLSLALNIANQRLPSLDDDRINSLLQNLNNTYTGKDYTTSNSGEINPADLDLYAKKHFPMCMRHMHDVLRSTHHLKHNCRFQYGLFLKGIGLNFEDALNFWREEFTKTMDHNKFEKDYVYNIKHCYGKVGSMVSYSPFSCIKVITQSVGIGEHHGCPFKLWEQHLLKQKMMDHGVSNEGMESVLELVKNGHFQVACTKYFEYTHSSQPPSTTINHPNQYFEESIKLVGDKKNV